MDTDTNILFRKNKLRKNRKRVVSTLFLYLFLFVSACDFKTPEDWVTPGWYIDLTLPLINSVYSFEELLSDSATFYSDTLDVAMFDTENKDTVLKVIHVSYPIDVPVQSIPDSIFNVNMASLGIDIPDMGVNDSIYILPPPLTIPPIPITLSNTGVFDVSSGCFPNTSIPLLSFPNIEQNSPGFDLFENSLFKIISITADAGIGITSIENNMPFPISVTNYSLTSGSDSFYDAEDTFDNIQPNTTTIDTFILDSPRKYIVEEGLTLQVESSVPTDPPGNTCDPDLGVDGWAIVGATQGVELNIGYELKNITNIEVEFYGTEVDTTMGQKIPGFSGMAIKKAIIAESTSPDTNMLLLDIDNNTPVGIEVEFDFLNFYDSLDGIWNALSKTIPIGENESVSYLNDENGKVNFSGYTLVKDEPPTIFDDLRAIDSIAFRVNLNMAPADYNIIVENNKMTLGVAINKVEIKNLHLDYIVAITQELELPSTSSPSIDIPDGFSDIEFMDLIIEMELFNEIGIPVDDINLTIQGTRGSSSATNTITTAIIAPIPSIENGCNYQETGDTARTVIHSNNIFQVTDYYCRPSDETPDYTGDTIFYNNNNFLDLLNFAPERITVSGNLKIEGEGILAKGKDIWGTFKLDLPLSFILKKRMTIIPAEPWPLPAIDDSTTSEQINSSMIEGEFFVDITNRSPAGGNLSLLISDSTIFPLFLDSLVTGSWDDQVYNFNTSVWDALEPPLLIDSIKFIPHPIADTLALEVQFFKQGTMQFFVGRMFDLQFPAPDSIKDHWGYYIPAFPGIHTSSQKLDTTILGWLITDQPRYSTPMINFDASPFQSIGDTIPITFQTTNAIEVQAYLTLKLDSGGLSRAKP